MARRRSYIYPIVLAASIIACNRQGENVKSGIVIRTPSRIHSNALVAGSTNCFAINLRKVGDTIMGGTCTLKSAMHSAFVPAGAEIALNPPPDTYLVDLYVYVDSNNGGCLPPLSDNWDITMNPSNLSKVFPAGTYSSPVTIVTGTGTSITMENAYNGTSLVAAQSLPAVCTGAVVSHPSSYSVGSGAQMLSGSGIVVNAKLQPNNGHALTGSGMAFIVK